VPFPFYRPEPALAGGGLFFKERKPLTKLDRNLTEFYREKKLGRSSFSSNLPVLHRLESLFVRDVMHGAETADGIGFPTGFGPQSGREADGSLFKEQKITI